MVPATGSTAWCLAEPAAHTIKLGADEPGTLGLHIGEGVETCLAACAGFCSAWALGTAGAIAAFLLPARGPVILLERRNRLTGNCQAIAGSRRS